MSDKETAISKIDEAVELIREVEAEVYQLRLNSQNDLAMMRKYEVLEDKLHDALAALGQ